MEPHTPSFTSPSSFPSLLPDTHRSPSWHYPTGPSSRYHISGRIRPPYARFQSSTTAPSSPMIGTERRAPRRTQSTAQVANIHAHGNLTPASSEYSRIPLLRYASSSTMASLVPSTPAKQAQGSRSQDSPFSDYFTDDARSVAQSGGGAMYNVPSSETQQMLVRLHKLQSQLMRSGDVAERDVLNVVGRKLGEIDGELDALHSQTRMPLDMDDSALFVDEDYEPPSTPSRRSLTGLASPMSSLNSTPPSDHVLTPENKIAEQDFQLLEAQRVLDAVTKVEKELRQRYADLVKSNNVHMQQIENRQQEIERLRSENEALRSDLDFDHSELLFLKLQMKAIKVDIGDAETEQIGSSTPTRSKSWRDRALKEADRWHTDWHDVDTRFRRRRSKYGVLSTDETERTPATEKSQETAGNEKADDWKLETVRKARGRVQSITITRRESGQQPVKPAGTADNGDEDQEMSEVEEKTYNNIRNEPSRLSRQSYSSSGTQTDTPPCAPDDADGEYDDESVDDCAITTSPGTPQQHSPVIRPMVAPAKTAWKELWEGLSSLAGMADADELD
ncbi:hypothetical protein LTR91_001529 [Friedmanniomyces endolithicus]|uniref:Uncharacterized protein n=1 Tax=Friedmanniomyces endolithicus TaxID=329885 RepID=A0A4U0US83_9PEZI|nr:hypothetical protein LTS09_008040 [Friedmanniomyces endolithicus]KAK0316640.1 hypothetical protein LTR01_000390 [Friedmanniomyces endolithicus]KAK0327848.1 hypothetical protein LTR82_001366 [Friedmanniomyces endolithicus]KAK0834817.1 hypothetical protein LTR73_001108 [Friedmanniomyces endolithicus]KAK0923609.1 hypothetical protein LTR57_006542 [Friedmanniomyces endolithicus]